jgi:c-di-GMP-binding flagellar brake protein YcgR
VDNDYAGRGMKRIITTIKPEIYPLTLWERVTILLAKNGHKSEFASRIEDIKQDSFVLEMPIRQRGELSLSKGDAVEVNYNKADSVYTFKASVLDLFEDSGAVAIEKKSPTSRLQRRKFIRLDISGKMAFRALDDPSGKGAGFGPEISGTLLNISAGGLLFECSHRLKSDGIILLNFTLKGKHALRDVMAVVKRCERSGAKNYLIGAEFMTRAHYRAHGLEKLDDFLPPGCGTFDENLQKLILRFIYDQQIEGKKRP